MGKIWLICLLMVCGSSAFTQELINRSKADVKDILASRGGKLTREIKSTGDLTLDTKFDELFYFFEDSTRLVNGIYRMELKFDKSTCFEYETNYSGTKFKAEMIAKFDNPSSGLKRTGGTLIWQNENKDYRIEIIDMFHNTILAPGGTPTDRFMVIINKTDKKYAHKVPDFVRQIDAGIKAAKKE